MIYNDIRRYDYHDDEPLITRMTQAKEYFENKFANIKVKTVVDFTEVEDKIDSSTAEIKDAIEDAKPCLCNLATKQDVCRAKCEIIHHIHEDKEEIVTEFNEKFYNLNEIVKNEINRSTGIDEKQSDEIDDINDKIEELDRPPYYETDED